MSDIDFVRSTECVLYNLYENVVKGGIILFDNYRGLELVESNIREKQELLINF